MLYDMGNEIRIKDLNQGIFLVSTMQNLCGFLRGKTLHFKIESDCSQMELLQTSVQQSTIYRQTQDCTELKLFSYYNKVSSATHNSLVYTILRLLINACKQLSDKQSTDRSFRNDNKTAYTHY